MPQGSPSIADRGRSPVSAVVADVRWSDAAQGGRRPGARGADHRQGFRRTVPAPAAVPWGWASSTRHQEAVSLLRGLPRRRHAPRLLVALLLCTCQRWDRVTAKLIAGIEECGGAERPRP